jgi:hypothetical protein
MNKQVHAILLDEFGTSAAAMLFEPSSKVAGDADVERPVWLAGENVDLIRVYAHRSAPTHEIPNAAQWVPAFAGTTFEHTSLLVKTSAAAFPKTP